MLSMCRICGISACLVTWLIDGLFVYTLRDALLERDMWHWHINDPFLNTLRERDRRHWHLQDHKRLHNSANELRRRLSTVFNTV